MDDPAAPRIWSDEFIDSLVTWTLVQTFHTVARDLTVLFASADLTPTQFGVLAHLGTGSSLLQAELAARVHVRPQSMGELLEGLLQRGLVEHLGSRGRGRRSRVVLTAAGSALLEATVPKVVQFNEPTRLGLTAAETRELNRLLHKVRRNQVEWSNSSPVGDSA